MEVATHGPPHYARNHSATSHIPSHHPLAAANRANMTASHQSPLVQSKAHTSSNHSIQSQPSSWASDTTQGTTHSTLFNVPNTSNPAMPPASAGTPHNGDVAPSENIMNSVADASSSLFQICVSLRQRLLGVPGFNDPAALVRRGPTRGLATTRITGTVLVVPDLLGSALTSGDTAFCTSQFIQTFDGG